MKIIYLICIGFIWRLNKNSRTKYKLDNNKITNIIGTQEIKVIQTKSFSAETNALWNWKLYNFIEKPILIPEDSVIYHGNDGSIDLRFGNCNYQAGITSS